MDDLWHGFLPNAIDTAILSSYVDENRSKGLKSLSKEDLDYDQITYDAVTTKVYNKADWNGKGRILQTYMEPTLSADGQTLVEDVEKIVVRHKMNQLTAREVLQYGADDTICTIAHANSFRIQMELEGTWEAMLEVEQFPAYLTALAHVQGVDFSLESMAKHEKDDNAAYDEAWPIVRNYLMKVGFEGTQCPYIVAGELPEGSPSHALSFKSSVDIKAMFTHLTGGIEIEGKVRLPAKLAMLMEAVADTLDEDQANTVMLFADAVRRADLVTMNQLVAMHFKGEPQLNFDSPKQVATLLYDHMKLPIHIVGNMTDIQRQKFPAMEAAVRKFKQIRAGKRGLSMTDDELKLLRHKAKSDDTAVDFAVAFDAEVVDEELRKVLKALGVVKKVLTMRKLFYKRYWVGLHWKDGKLHCSFNQCAAVTRRYSMSNQNLQQLPKKGKGVRFRSHFLPHHKYAVIVSIDYVGQELRLAADRSQDKNMLACYVGDSLKDIHSITAAGAMRKKWGDDFVNQMFAEYGDGLKKTDDGHYELFLRLRKLGLDDAVEKKADDLRKEAKNVNFGAQNGAMAPKLSETLIISVEDAQLFLDAREEMFPGVSIAAEKAADKAKASGCAYTLMGVPRHLRTAMLSDERGAADRAARQAWNFEIQGSAGEMSKLGMSRMWKAGIYFKYDARFIAPVHDELVSSVSAAHALDFIREKHACMTQSYATMQVPILGSISLGPNFAEQIECGDWFIQDRIEAALNKVFPHKVNHESKQSQVGEAIGIG